MGGWNFLFLDWQIKIWALPILRHFHSLPCIVFHASLGTRIWSLPTCWVLVLTSKLCAKTRPNVSSTWQGQNPLLPLQLWKTISNLCCSCLWPMPLMAYFHLIQCSRCIWHVCPIFTAYVWAHILLLIHIIYSYIYIYTDDVCIYNDTCWYMYI